MIFKMMQKLISDFFYSLKFLHIAYTVKKKEKKTLNVFILNSLHMSPSVLTFLFITLTI